MILTQTPIFFLLLFERHSFMRSKTSRCSIVNNSFMNNTVAFPQTGSCSALEFCLCICVGAKLADTSSLKTGAPCEETT